LGCGMHLESVDIVCQQLAAYADLAKDREEKGANLRMDR
jgi:hypothetical protein